MNALELNVVNMRIILVSKGIIHLGDDFLLTPCFNLYGGHTTSAVHGPDQLGPNTKPALLDRIWDVCLRPLVGLGLYKLQGLTIGPPAFPKYIYFK